MIWPWQRSVQARLLLILVGLLAGVLVLLNLSMGWLLVGAQVEEAANHLQIQSLIAARSLEDPLSVYSHELEEHERYEHSGQRRSHDRDDSEESTDLLSDWVHRFASESGSEVTVTDSSGRPLATTSELEPLTSDELQGARNGTPRHRVSGVSIFAVAPVMRGERLLGVVRLSTSKKEALRRSSVLSANIALASLGTLAVAVLAALWLSRRLVQPIKRLERIAALTAQGEWDHEFPVEGQDEIASLAGTFSDMLAALKSLLQRQRRFVSDASHELRTPLTRMKIRTEALLDGALDDPDVAGKFLKEIDQELDRMSALTTSLLDLSRHGERAVKAQVVLEPSTVITSAVNAHRSTAEQRQVQLLLQVPQSLPSLPLSTESLEIIIDNLLTNALKFTPSGGRVSLVATSFPTHVSLAVQDTGVGIDPEHLPHLFERFYRADTARTTEGAGLGLALVQAAVDSAGGSVDVESRPGDGSTFVVTLPRADHKAS